MRSARERWPCQLFLLGMVSALGYKTTEYAVELLRCLELAMHHCSASPFDHTTPGAQVGRPSIYLKSKRVFGLIWQMVPGSARLSLAKSSAHAANYQHTRPLDRVFHLMHSTQANAAHLVKSRQSLSKARYMLALPTSLPSFVGCNAWLLTQHCTRSLWLNLASV